MNTALIVAGSLAGLGFAEIVVRAAKPQPVYLTEAPGIFFIRHDTLLGWANREGAEGIYAPAPAIPRTSVRINALGYRGELRPKTKSSRQRILFLGDSNTFGYGVEERERFSELLEKMSSGRFEQVNLGVFGYGTDQEALQLESSGIEWRPDQVVLAVSAGDLSDSMSSVNGGAAKPYFKLFGDRLMVQNTPVPEKSPYLRSTAASSRIKRWCYVHSHLYRFFITRRITANMYMADSVMEMKEGEGLQVMSTLLSGMRDICRENGAGFSVLLIPHGVWLDSMRDNPGMPMPGYFGVLKRRLEADGIPVHDPTEALLAALREGTEVFFTKDPVHLTSQGNAVIARFLFPHL
jgi:lysophospholipase L1-like esterase